MSQGKSIFQVIVGNVGTVYSGNNFMQAECKFTAYVKDSQTGLGRSGGESVVLMHNGEIRKEFVGAIDQKQGE